MAAVEEWKPHDGQQAFALAQPKEVFEELYGGARGGGKTEAGIVWITEPMDHPRYSGLVLRKNAKDLSGWVRRTKYMMRGTGMETVGNPPALRFPSGAVIETGHLKDERAIDQYQGGEYHRMLLEELTQISSEDRYLQLLASCRSTIDGLTPQVFATTNPGGIGHAWVKGRFIDAGEPNVPAQDHDSKLWRIFIPATIDDNPTLMNKDPSYVQRIDALKKTDPDLYRAWRYGDWDVFIGQMFSSWRHEKHVLSTMPVELAKCRRIMCFDWGYTNPACMLWLAVTPPDTNGSQFVFVYREVYVTENTAEAWGKMLAVFNRYDKVDYCVLPHDCFSIKGDENTIAQVIQKWNPDMSVKKGNTLVANARMNRAQITLQMLSDSPSVDQRPGRPYLQVAATCKNLIRTLPNLVRDEKNPEVVDKRGEDHAFDALSLGLITLSDDGYLNPPILQARQQMQLPAQWASNQAGQLTTSNFWDELRKSGQQPTNTNDAESVE